MNKNVIYCLICDYVSTNPIMYDLKAHELRLLFSLHLYEHHTFLELMATSCTGNQANWTDFHANDDAYLAHIGD